MDLKAVLEKIGWSNGFHVPIANAENQALEEELEKLCQRKARAKIANDESKARYEALDKHLKYVKQELEQNQKLLTAYVQQVDNERHKLKETKAQHEKVNQERRQISKHIEEISIRQQNKKNDLSKTLNKIEKIKAETAWDAEALKAWEDALNKRDDDKDLLKKYSKLDEHKIQELDARRQNLQLEVCEKRATVEKMMAEIRNYEQMLDRTDKLFRQQEDERKSLVTKWQDAVKNLRQRDEDIAKLNQEMIETQYAIRQKQEELEEQDTFLNNEKNNNHKLELEVEDLNAKNSRMRRELNDIVQTTITLKNDVHTIKRNLASISSKLEKERQEGKAQALELENIEAKIAHAAADVDELRRKLEEVRNSTMSSTDRTTRLEQMIKVGQQLTKNLLTDSEKAQGILFRNQVGIGDLRDVKVSLEANISGIEVSNRHLEKQIKSKLAELNLSREMVYGLSYRINQIEVKIATIEGQEKLDEESEILNAKIEELEKILAEHNDVKHFLQSQVTRLQDEMRRLITAIADDTEKLDELKNKLQDQVLLFEGGLKHAAAAKLKAQQKQVEENVLRLRVVQLEKAISKEDDHIFDLQKFRLQLETSLKERQIEIQTHKEVLQAEKKNLDETRGRLKADINHRKVRIEQFQKKYHLALMSLGTDEEGQPLSISYFKIKDAQERYMLQQEGDELDNKIKKAEREIVAMENTLKVVNVSNTAYKRSLMPEEEDEEMKEMIQLEQDIRNTTVTLTQAKKSLKEKKQHLKYIQESISNIHTIEEVERSKLDELRETYERLLGETEGRSQRLNKAILDARMYKKRAPKASLEKPERNLEIRQLQDANNEIHHQLRNLMSDHEDTIPIITQMMRNYELELQQGPKSRDGTTSSSSMVPLTRSARSLPSSLSSSSSSQSVLTPVILTFDGEGRKNPTAPKK